jgi:hypothetical protein
VARFDVHGGFIGTLEQLVKVDSMAGLLRGRFRCLGAGLRRAGTACVAFVAGSDTRWGECQRGQCDRCEIEIYAVRPDGADHQWRRVPPRELSIALVADERSGRVTGWTEAS